MQEVCYIVGAGPNGIEGYDRIPKDAHIVCCNSAILKAEEYGWEPEFWVSDHNVLKTDWFKEIYGKYPLWGSRKIASRVDVEVTWNEKPWFTRDDYAPIEGVYRGGGTIVGSVVQRCYWKNCTPILCGADMGGTTNITGLTYIEGHWIKRRNRLNNFIIEYVPHTVSLTPTTLDVPLI